MFFRVSAMLSGNKSMILNIKQHVPSAAISVPGQTRSLKISGTIDYAAFATDPHKHGGSTFSVYLIALRFFVESFIQSSPIQYVKLQNSNGLFVTEAKQEDVPIAQQVPRAVAEMYVSAKYLKYDLVFCSCLSLMNHVLLTKGFSAAL